MGPKRFPHEVDVTELDVDFYAFSGHKMMSPTGIGSRTCKQALFFPYPLIRYGGEMIGTGNRTGKYLGGPCRTSLRPDPKHRRGRW
ncbi:aminotransferase class V-fold PLP-dependent enzyme [Limosilactobacillus fermentum]